MLRCYSLVFFCYFTVVLGQIVQFPDEKNPQQNEQPQTRFGLKYLGYFLSLLSSTFAGYQGIPIQTPTGTTAQSVTSLPLFSASPANSSVLNDRTTTEETAVSNIMSGASTLPTALPSSFPAGIVTSFGTFPPVVTPRPAEIVVPHVTTDGRFCGCLPLSACVNQTIRSEFSVRIVTTPPQGVTCPAGLVYCCAPNRAHLCGLQNIIPGVTPRAGQANLGEFPWSAIILTQGDVYVGGGALIDELHVLTAAHKVANYGNGGTLKVRFGDWDLSSSTEPVSYREVGVSAITNHPNYDSVNLKSDISILTLASSVPTLTSPNPQINTICLPPANELFAGSRCWVSGWGKDQFNGAYQQIIKKVNLPVITATDCQTRLRQTRLGSSFVLDSNSFLCAGGEPNRDACTGDGGNALACERNGQFYVAGITVGGINCGLANVPGLYVNVINFLPWINSVVNPTTGGIDPRRKPTT